MDSRLRGNDDGCAGMTLSSAAIRSGQRMANQSVGRSMSPTIFRHGAFRFFFFSREEPRMHVHVTCADGEAKYWLEPAIQLAQNYRLSEAQLRAVEALIRQHEKEIRSAWTKHFES
jgi:hypothetical protein